jgi:ankyrin repeat protein
MLQQVAFNFATNGTKAVCLAARYGDLEMLKYLISQGVKAFVNYNEPLRMTCRYGYEDCFQFIVSQQGVNPRANSDEPLNLACKSGAIGIVRKLLTCQGIEECLATNKPLYEACENNQLEVAKLLLSDPRVDPSKYEKTSILESAAEAGNEQLVALIVQHDSFSKFESVLSDAIACAAHYGHYGVVLLLTAQRSLKTSFLKGALFNAGIGFHHDVLKHLFEVTRQDEMWNCTFWVNLRKYL